MEAFHYAMMQAEPDAPYKLVLLAEMAGPVETLSGITLVADHCINDFAEPIDTLLVPGMRTGDTRFRDGALLDWLWRTAPTVRRLASICSGALMLGEAGLLDGKSVTTHWMDARDLRALVPTAHVASDQIYLKDGTLYSSGGVTAGIDLALALIEEDLGHATALKIAKRMIVPLKRAGNQAQFSDLLLAQEKASRFHELLDWIEANLARRITVLDMAEEASMSSRNFSRQFAAELGVPPMRYVKHRRLERARLLLEETAKNVQTIAAETGFYGAERLRRQFVESFSIGPRAYRARFGCKGKRLT